MTLQVYGIAGPGYATSFSSSIALAFRSVCSVCFAGGFSQLFPELRVQFPLFTPHLVLFYAPATLRLLSILLPAVESELLIYASSLSLFAFFT